MEYPSQSGTQNAAKRSPKIKAPDRANKVDRSTTHCRLCKLLDSGCFRVILIQVRLFTTGDAVVDQDVNVHPPILGWCIDGRRPSGVHTLAEMTGWSVPDACCAATNATRRSIRARRTNEL